MSASPSIYRLIAVYWDRYATLDASTRALDETEDGTPARKKADAAFSRACDRTTDALVDICAFLPTWKYEARLKARFIETAIADTGATIDGEVLAALLKSGAQLVLPVKEHAPAAAQDCAGL